MKDKEQEKEFIALIEAYKQVIFKVCYMYTADPDELNDYYQEVVISIWKAYPKFRHESKISTWVYRISLFTCISYIRRGRSKPQFVPLSINHEMFDDADERRGQLKEMYVLINRLGKLDKALILLWLEDKTYQEIAEITRLSRNNVAVKLMRIKDKLKTMYND